MRSTTSGKEAENSSQCLVCLLAYLMARAYMPDLVPEHRGEFSFVVQVREDAAGDIDIAARKRKGVDFLAINDSEVPLQLRPLAGVCQFLADLVDVILQCLVLVDAVELDDLLVGLAALLDLTLLGHQRDIGVTRGWVACAACDKHGAAHQNGAD